MAQRLRIQRCSWNGNGYLVLVFDNFMFSFRDFCHKIAVFFIHFKLSQIIVDKWRIKNFVFFSVRLAIERNDQHLQLN